MLLQKQLKNNYCIDSSIRVGQVKSGYQNPNLSDGLGNIASYKSDPVYYSAHLGLGKNYKLKNNAELNIYTKYLYSHLNLEKLTILGDTVNFKGVNSHRLQIGSKYTFNKTDKSNYYIGLAYEYEFFGTARASVYGYDLAAPSIKGSTGIMELGMQLKPKANSNITLDFGNKAMSANAKVCLVVCK